MHHSCQAGPVGFPVGADDEGTLRGRITRLAHSPTGRQWHFLLAADIKMKRQHRVCCHPRAEQSSPPPSGATVGSAARKGDTDLAWLGRMFFWVSLVPASSMIT